MSYQTEAYTALPTFFAEGAFAETRRDFNGISYDTDLLEKADRFMHNEIGRGLPGGIDNTTFVYRFAEPGYRRPDPDPNFMQANPGTLYIPADQLEIGPEQQPARVISKAAIAAIGHPIMQVQIKEGRLPSMNALAESVLYPVAEDHRMAAGVTAWARQFKEAFTPRESAGNQTRMMEEVTARFSGAIALRPRPKKRTTS